jgi:hypothetical protein
LKGSLEDVLLLKKAGANYSEMSSPFVKNWGFIKEIVLYVKIMKQKGLITADNTIPTATHVSEKRIIYI